MLLRGTIKSVYKGTLVYAFEHNPSEQTDPLQPLPTVFGSWMGNRITPSILSELFC